METEKIQRISDFFKPGEIEKYEKNFSLYTQSAFYRKYCQFRFSFNRIGQTLKIIAENPYLIPKILKNYFDKFFMGKQRLRSLEIAVEYNCNSKCDQCSCRLAYDPSKKRLTMAEFKNIIDQARAMGAFQFCLTGGEPLLQLNDVLEITKYLRSKKCYVHLCSNGLLMTEETLKKLAEAGLSSLEMGLDSALPEIHDDNRRENGYTKIMQEIEWARPLKIRVTLNTISTHEKIKNHDLLALVKLAQTKKVNLQITPPCVTGAWKNRIEILMNDKEKQYFWWLMKFSSVRTDMYSSLTTVRCPAAREKIGVQPYGDVVSCPLIQVIYGNVKNESLEQIVEKMLKNPFYSKTAFCLPAFEKEFIEKYLMDK